AKDVALKQARVLIMGVTFKENVTDIRNSKVIDVIQEFQSYGVKVEAIDPMADKDEFNHEYKFMLSDKAEGTYDAVILAVSHDAYKNFDEAYIKSLLNENGVFADLKGLYRRKFNVDYWSL
ncbi:MAG TPA: UDP binding domain-containing protein, partial [Bacteroidia bacterium]